MAGKATGAVVPAAVAPQPLVYTPPAGYVIPAASVPNIPAVAHAPTPVEVWSWWDFVTRSVDQGTSQERGNNLIASLTWVVGGVLRNLFMAAPEIVPLAESHEIATMKAQTKNVAQWVLYAPDGRVTPVPLPVAVGANPAGTLPANNADANIAGGAPVFMPPTFGHIGAVLTGPQMAAILRFYGVAVPHSNDDRRDRIREILLGDYV
eukprot:TRINITY_DN2713_c0_g1_i1.p1 TRINITY_DN2713_c0_g1~~TRINITY_DN2713_c0_g1_i1.p1  ORF type:complete len:207 (-),score=30.69 TRINITY_DN2713_c0_g1_i1:78-698(-)